MGILFTLMGVTNIGKTTQQDLLEKRLASEGFMISKVKYPRYDLLPTGPRINAYLRGGNPEGLSPQEFQTLHVQNKFDFEAELLKLLETNDIVIAEMYSGTGIAYGMGDGLDKEWFVDQYKNLHVPDVSILLDGKRFLESREANHIFENDDVKTEVIRLAHLELAKDFDWKIVSANGAVEDVHNEIYNSIIPFLKK